MFTNKLVIIAACLVLAAAEPPSGYNYPRPQQQLIDVRTTQHYVEQPKVYTRPVQQYIQPVQQYVPPPQTLLRQYVQPARPVQQYIAPAKTYGPPPVRQYVQPRPIQQFVQPRPIPQYVPPPPVRQYVQQPAPVYGPPPVHQYIQPVKAYTTTQIQQPAPVQQYVQQVQQYVPPPQPIRPYVQPVPAPVYGPPPRQQYIEPVKAYSPPVQQQIEIQQPQQVEPIQSSYEAPLIPVQQTLAIQETPRFDAQVFSPQIQQTSDDVSNIEVSEARNTADFQSEVSSNYNIQSLQQPSNSYATPY